MSYSLRQYDMLVIPTPGWVTGNHLVSNALTWGTLLIEFAIGVLVWNRRCRPWVLAGGVILHLSIMLTIAVGLFSFAVYVLYLAFIPSDRVKAMVDKLQDTLSAVTSRLKRRQVTSDDDDDDDGEAAERGGKKDVDRQPPVQRAPEPAVAVSRNRAAPDAARRNGHPRTPKGENVDGRPMRGRTVVRIPTPSR